MRKLCKTGMAVGTMLFLLLMCSFHPALAAEGYSYPQELQELTAALDQACEGNQDLIFHTQIRSGDMPDFLSYVVCTSIIEFEGRWMVGSDASGNGFLYIPAETVQKLYGHYEESVQALNQVCASFEFTDESAAKKAEIIKTWIQSNVKQDENCINNSLYGALVQKSSKSRGVAIAYKHLCELAQIPCQIVCGKADNGVLTETHLWNRIQLDGEWIHVDVMWNLESEEPLENHYEEKFYQ